MFSRVLPFALSLVSLTSVAASVVLVNLHPVVIVTGSALFLNERPTARQAVGIAIATGNGAPKGTRKAERSGSVGIVLRCRRSPIC